MLHTIVKKGAYQDSVVLMLLTNKISAMDGVKKVSIMMATPANKEMYKAGGMDTEELLNANANDMVIVADVDDPAMMDRILAETEDFLRNQATASGNEGETETVKSWEKALEKNFGANLALISIPGIYAAAEADRALDEGMNVFMFSDNVTIEDERRLKEKAHKKGLVVMGPDCGTGIIQGVPIAFTNSVRKGKIGIVGASGTGIQELTTIIDRLGEGVTNAIGTGGRDLSTAVGGITMLDCVNAMDRDADTQVLIVITKPPAKEVRDRIYARLTRCSKPVVTVFLGEKPEYHEEGLYHAYTLDEAARIAVQLLHGEEVRPVRAKLPEGEFFQKSENKTIKAYYSGGTLAGEAAMLIKDSLNLKIPPEKAEGFMLKTGGHIVVDLGDDVYTQGKPHPMIDPTKRIECMRDACDDPTTGVILLDVVLGYGSHEDMAGALIPTILDLQKKAEDEKRKLFFVATVCGTRTDFQNYDEQVKKLRKANVYVCESNKIAVETAIRMIGRSVEEPEKEVRPKKALDCTVEEPSEALMRMISEKPVTLNIGLKSFAQVIKEYNCKVLQFDWTPPAGGDLEMISTLRFLRGYETSGNREFKNIDEANRAVIEKVIAAQPILKDVRLAKDLIPELREGKAVLHAGPPIRYENMPDPVHGSCIGAALFEGWADDVESAKRLFETGEVKLIPCHHVNAVGPMGGITTAHMPMFVVENETDGNKAYCTMNEGIGKVLRFGAYSEEVVTRLHWMADVLGPTLGKAIRSIEGGLSLNPLIAKAIAMGDEFHQRNIAASLCFLKEMSPIIVGLDMNEKDRKDVIKFLADTDQFFLNIMMAACKSVMDGARKIQAGTVVTAMCRNGENFGIRISGMGDEWFTAPVNTPQGLYFTGYDGEDASPDMGDSSITETFGVGGAAMIAAPAVTRFVGAGGYEDALRTSNEMTEIYLDHNPNFIVPTWNFQGICLGIDSRLVVEKEITPVINTGIAHKIAGYGQIGAGTVHPPIECFQKAVKAYARKLGYRG